MKVDDVVGDVLGEVAVEVPDEVVGEVVAEEVGELLGGVADEEVCEVVTEIVCVPLQRTKMWKAGCSWGLRKMVKTMTSFSTWWGVRPLVLKMM